MKKLILIAMLFLSAGAYAQTADTAQKNNSTSSASIKLTNDFQKNNPLYIIDGIPSNADYLKKLNPADIDNISVLKGNSAKALYGAAAKNGAIIVVTKAFKKQQEAKKAEVERQGKRN